MLTITKMEREQQFADIEPKLLLWARESIGLSLEEVSKQVKAGKEVINEWESGKKKPTLTQIRKLSKIYKRPLAVFYLSEPPKEPPLPKDFRTIPSDKVNPLSTKTRLAVRRARRLQSLASELTEEKVKLLFPRIKITDNINNIINQVREQFNISIEAQFKWKDETEAFNEWRRLIENQGIFIFQIGMPKEDGVRGFSFIENGPPAIVLNLRDAINGRIFSLFHEYAHICLNNSGLCDMKEGSDLSGNDKKIEQFCNYFAGSLLVPEQALLENRIVHSKGYSEDWTNDELKRIAKDFKVSQEVILRRLLILKYTSTNFYQQKREEWESIKKEKRGGRQNPPKKCIQGNGVPFVSLVLESYKKEKITYNDVADYLSLRFKYIPKVEKIIQGNP